MTRPTSSDLGRNLRFLCSYYRSVSEVCRRLKINRQQFNRYLEGESRPSPHNLRRICDFFGLEEYELLYPADKLRALVEVKGVLRHTTGEPFYVAQIEALLRDADPGVERYYGHYFKYYYSFSYPGKILKALVVISERDGVPCHKCVERLVERPRPAGRAFVFKYLGVVALLKQRIFMIDREQLTGNEISQTILYPSFKNKVDRLTGLIVGTSGGTFREPLCSRVVLERLERGVHLKKALRSCGLYAPDAPEIGEEIRRSIRNRIEEGEFHLRALAL